MIAAHGEEELLAYYATRINDDGDHDFIAPNGAAWKKDDRLTLGAGLYTDFISSPQYKSKKAADKVSYTWDELITTFTGHMLAGTSIVLPGHEYSLTNSEKAVRYMALENRFARRGYSQAILEALKIGRKREVFFRAMIAPAESKNCETGFFFLTLKYLHWMEEKGGYEKYRQMRTFYLQTYAQAILMKFPYLRRIVGIAMEPPGQGRGASEDCIYAEQTDWTDADRARVRADCDQLGIMGSMKQTDYRHDEYPLDLPVSSRNAPHPEGNRRERRAKRARSRKAKNKLHRSR